MNNYRGEWFIVWFRGISQARTTVIKMRLTCEEAIAIEKKLMDALDAKWLAEAHMVAFLLLDQQKSPVAKNMIASLCSVDRLGPEFLRSLDAQIRDEATL